MAVGRQEAREKGSGAAVGSKDPVAAAVHLEITAETRTNIEIKRQNAITKKAAFALTNKIAMNRQKAITKKEFMVWERSVNQHHEDKIKQDKEHEQDCGDYVHKGTALPGNNAVHAALGRKPRKQRKAQTCHFGHTTTTSRVWLRNPIPSFWVGVPSEVLLCYRCYQRGYRGGLPPERADNENNTEVNDNKHANDIPATDAPT